MLYKNDRLGKGGQDTPADGEAQECYVNFTSSCVKNQEFSIFTKEDVNFMRMKKIGDKWKNSKLRKILNSSSFTENQHRTITVFFGSIIMGFTFLGASDKKDLCDSLYELVNCWEVNSVSEFFYSFLTFLFDVVGVAIRIAGFWICGYIAFGIVFFPLWRKNYAEDRESPFLKSNLSCLLWVTIALTIYLLIIW